MSGETKYGPSTPKLWLAVVLAVLFLVASFAMPILALSLPRPDEQPLDLWFQRSGSVTTVFALIAEMVIVRAKLSITPAGFGWPGLNEQRRFFIPLLGKIEWPMLVLTITGTLIWGYGDIYLQKVFHF